MRCIYNRETKKFYRRLFNNRHLVTYASPQFVHHGPPLATEPSLSLCDAENYLSSGLQTGNYTKV